MMRKRAEDIITYELSKETRAYERSKKGGSNRGVFVFFCLFGREELYILPDKHNGNLVR